MKTICNDLPKEIIPNQPLGFARILSILTIVLKHVCPNIRDLTLCMEDRVRDKNFKDSMLWDDDPSNNSGKSDYQMIDEVVENVLESLKVLKLGTSYHFHDDRDENENEQDNERPTPQFEDEWGRSAR